MADYDPQILKKYADQLYSRAYATIAGYALFGFIIGWGGTVFFSELQPRLGIDNGSGMIIGIILAVLAGVYGSSKAFKYKLEAQQTLCQMKIEEHTRALLDRERSEPEYRRAAGA